MNSHLNQIRSSLYAFFRSRAGRFSMVSLPSLIIATMKGVSLVLVAWFSLSHLQRPFTEYALLLFNGVLVAGVLIILFFMYKDYARHGPRLRVLFSGATALLATLSAVGNFGDTAVGNPVISLVILLGVACGHTVASLCRLAIGHEDEQQFAGSPPCIPVALQQRDATTQDRRFIAAHEAGHALVYAAWSPFPDGLKVRVKKGADGSNSLGFVNDGQQRHLLTEKTFAEWDMLLSLAGSAGERCYTGKVTLGAFNDATRWLATATPYLTCYLTDGVFYPEPASRHEMLSNQHHLAVLKQTHRALLDEFFDRNHEVHTRLTEALLNVETLSGAQLHPYLAAVQLPDNFPRLHNVNTLA
ncbi:TPA: hypothetical protein ACWSSN_003275 [Escherichia coli]